MIRKCDKCGHDWNQRFPGIPKICPKCKTKRWNTNGDAPELAGMFNCLKCGYKWFGRTEERPIVCPRCMDPRWFKNRKEKK